MWREIGNQNPSTGLRYPDGLPQRSLWIVEIVQHLMKDHSIEARFRVALGKRQPVDIAAPYLALRSTGFRQPFARDRQHLETYVDAKSTSDMRRQQLQHAAGSGSGIEHMVQLLGSQQPNDGGLYVLLGDMQRADALPLRRVGFEISGGFLGPRGADFGEAAAIIRELSGLRFARQRSERACQHSCVAAIRGAIEHPGTLFEALEQARIAEKLQMPADAGLALAKDLGQLADGQFRQNQQQKQPQAGAVSRRMQHCSKVSVLNMVSKKEIRAVQFVLRDKEPHQSKMNLLKAIVPALLVGFLLAGCATQRANGPQDTNDPFEPFNRAMFNATLAVDKAVFRPTAIVYRRVLPQPIRDSFRSFLNNLDSPVIFTNDIPRAN